MKRAAACSLLPFLAVFSLLLGGCSTYSTRTEGSKLAAAKRYFIVSNLNDNHALDSQIASALKVRNHEADTGPLTMMDDATEVVVTYEDHWTWDFGDHLVYLQINARERRSGKPLGSVNYKATIPTNKSISRIVGDLVDHLLGGGHG